MRKRAAWLAADALSYVTGGTELGSLAGAADDWLHPVECDFCLADPERHFHPLDQADLPMQLIGERPVHVPSRTAAFAFAHWNRWRRQGGDAHLAAFLKAAAWFASFQGGRIEHRFDLAGLRSPWLSGLAQGEALSVFARAELVTGDGGWLERCEPVLDWLCRPVAQGGVIDRLPDGSPFIEEYPGARHRHVLNGCLYALVGLDDMLRRGASARARSLLDEVVAGVERNILHWEANGWSLYEYAGEGGARARNFNTPSYQVVHIALLEHLSRRTGSAVLAAAAARLRAALASPAARLRALRGKIAFRLRTGW